jgi:hypothetical protein
MLKVHYKVIRMSNVEKIRADQNVKYDLPMGFGLLNLT